MEPHEGKPAADADWWKHGVIYQVYPRSFQDSNGDGIGDIPGIISRLDYLHDLGISALWLSPVYPSPMYDFGYDVSDYKSIDPVFGTLDDFDQLIIAARLRGIRIIMDLVLNHTSYLHPWFAGARSSRNDPHHDWYIWHDGRNGGRKVPNNWKSAFGGSAWQWDPDIGRYYLHSFLKEQPDLNWRTPSLRQAMYNVMRFWLDRGVAGFRLDVVNWLMKDPAMRNNPPSLKPHQFLTVRYDRNRPDTCNILGEIRDMLDREYPHAMTVGEVFCMPPGNPSLSATFMGREGHGLHMAFDFSLLYAPWKARKVYPILSRWYRHIPPGGWPCHVLSNHDQPRTVTRLGGGEDGLHRARAAATLLLTQRGTPFLYYGEEIGMDGTKLSRNQIQDPLGERYWPFFAGRDPARTPMQWSDCENGGFTGGTSWLPLSRYYSTVNVELQARDRWSMLHHYRSLISLRNSRRALHTGDIIPAVKGHGDILAYYRIQGEEMLFVFINFSGRRRSFHVRDRAQWRVIHSTHRSTREYFADLNIDPVMPYEATILERIGEL